MMGPKSCTADYLPNDSYQPLIVTYTNMMGPKSRRGGQLPSIQEEEFLNQMKLEQQQITNIKKQREMIISIHKTISKKDQEIQRLTGLVEKYQPSYQLQAQMRIELAEKDSMNKSLISQNQFLRKGFQSVLEECEGLTRQIRQNDMERQALIRQRISIERMNRDIEQTFREYKQQCSLRQEELIKDIAQMQSVNESLQREVEQLKTSKKSDGDSDQAATLKAEIKRLSHELSERQAELLKNRKLNHELSIEFDRSVNKIVQFEQELKQYRKDNHQLKKTLGLVLEQQKYQKLRQKYSKNDSQDNVNIDQQSLEEQNSSDGRCDEEESSPELSSIKY